MDARGMSWSFLIPFLLFFSFTINLSSAADSITRGQPLSGNNTIVSKGGIFELGFFTPAGNSQNSYIAIWFKQIPIRTPVWIANRDRPINNTNTSKFVFSEDGNLVLTQSSIQVWSSNLSVPTSNSTAATLLDTGNLLLRDASDMSNVLWQSFDHPTDHWLPSQRLGLNRITGKNQLLLSWKNLEDPSTGLFAHGLDIHDTNQFILWRNGTQYWNSGNWDGTIFSNMPGMKARKVMNYVRVSNEKETYFTYTFTDNSTTSRLMMDVTGQVKISKWLENSQEWLWIFILPYDPCSVPHLCGAFGSCSSQTLPFCSCPDGFEPKFDNYWKLSDWSGGCVRSTPLQCGNLNSTYRPIDEFLMVSNAQLPKNSLNFVVGSAKQCELACLNNCSCIAYSLSSSSSSSRCLMWFDELYDLKVLSSDSNSGGTDSGVLNLRVAASNQPTDSKRRHGYNVIIISLSAGFAACLIAIMALGLRLKYRSSVVPSEWTDGSLLLFSYKDLQRATSSFSEKLGSGSFGTVFKAKMPNSTTIAVKKLEGSRQGEKQFRAELNTIGMIKHVNLVSLLGFCSEGSERMLVYEYMPNGSLDRHLFRKGYNLLDWTTRYKIVTGVARGLAYLHDSCRECIIHGDVKPENVLLDAEFSPKIADFGLAKLFGREFSRVLTTVRGTLGYLAPEWISGLAITPKVDVYSYGMMLLEIIRGKRNAMEWEDGELAFSPVWAASRVQEGDVLSLLDCRLECNADIDELRRACRVAIWCIQDDENHRPTMSLVLQILEGVSEVKIPPIPKQIYELYI